MPKYTVAATILASFSVEAVSGSEAAAIIRNMIRSHDANFGMLHGEACVVPVDVEGSLSVELDSEEEN